MAVEVEKSENRKHLATALAIGLVLALLVGMLLWNRFRLTRHQKVLIETEKAKVDQAYLSLNQEREKLDQANSDLHTANGKLKELDDFKSRFFTNISHEFRTPLTLISGVARQLQENPKKWGKEGPQLIERNAARLTHMINQILDLRKLESGNLNLQPIQDDVLPFLQYSIQSFDSLAAERSISLTFETELTDLLMDFDPDKLLQVQTNLLANALKFTPQGGRVVVHVNRSPDQRLMLQVQDTGRGIPPNKLSLIFDRFYQVNSHDISEGEGTGIGLSLTKELVSLMNGDIQVESVEGQGSVFTVLLPITHDAPVKVATVQPTAVAHIAPIPKVESSSSLSTDERPSLLIIEDNADIVSYLYTTLEDHYVLYSASDGQAGIEFALEQVPDLIITDVMMPYKNGYEVCEILKLDPRTSHIPIVMLTAKADQESRLEGYKRGADAYLPKPFDQNELLIRIEKLLELRLTLQTRYQNIFQLSQNDDPLIQIEDEFITQARKLILANLDNNKYRGEALGRDLAMSRTNIHRKIKALTGLSTCHFIRNIKIDHAKELLTTSSMQVAEVAYAVGFNDPSYFSRIFSDRVGTTPGEWRMGGGKKETDNHYLE
ncbi:MAG: ATP-binding protein [Bacteroidota bacterium]